MVNLTKKYNYIYIGNHIIHYHYHGYHFYNHFVCTETQVRCARHCCPPFHLHEPQMQLCTAATPQMKWIGPAGFPSKQCCCDVGPVSWTVEKHYINAGSMLQTPDGDSKPPSVQHSVFAGVQ